MEEKYFLHRIKKEAGAFTKGVEVHDTLASAARAFHGQLKTGYNNPSFPNVTFVQCFVTDGRGQIVQPYAATWLKAQEQNAFFLHYARRDGETYTKGIDVCATMDAAAQAFHAQMEYGYDNDKFPGVSFVSCHVTDLLSGGMVLTAETWNRAEPEE